MQCAVNNQISPPSLPPPVLNYLPFKILQLFLVLEPLWEEGGTYDKDRRAEIRKEPPRCPWSYQPSGPSVPTNHCQNTLNSQPLCSLHWTLWNTQICRSPLLMNLSRTTLYSWTISDFTFTCISCTNLACIHKCDHFHCDSCILCNMSDPALHFSCIYYVFV